MTLEHVAIEERVKKLTGSHPYYFGNESSNAQLYISQKLYKDFCCYFGKGSVSDVALRKRCLKKLVQRAFETTRGIKKNRATKRMHVFIGDQILYFWVTPSEFDEYVRVFSHSKQTLLMKQRKRVCSELIAVAFIQGMSTRFSEWR
ncbi:hypothetical protein [Vibrio aestuarianus]|uniref:hypothetical protein n=1 Tax=Vibrio aestuarianus TaxID=28171 RepID=UPI00237CA6F4|nr:hypothetical protein [Vibrio aestuarianus]MDE1266084.1 hypothetical protein [Vibrio aestuarianus]MDE1298274.1 hypothetical protein [Vibrio aestuarianus]